MSQGVLWEGSSPPPGPAGRGPGAPAVCWGGPGNKWASLLPEMQGREDLERSDGGGGFLLLESSSAVPPSRSCQGIWQASPSTHCAPLGNACAGEGRSGAAAAGRNWVRPQQQNSSDWLRHCRCCDLWRRRFSEARKLVLPPGLSAELTEVEAVEVQGSFVLGFGW